jgi:hypothetical protein
MMLHPSSLGEPTVDEAMKTLFAEVEVPDVAYPVLPLYRLKMRDDILEAMPRFDQWGPRPEGQEGECENPLLPVPGSGPEEEAEESEGAGAGEAESSRTHRKLFVQAISFNDEDAAEEFIVAPSRRGLTRKTTRPATSLARRRAPSPRPPLAEVARAALAPLAPKWE